MLTGLDPLRVAVRYRGSEGAVFDEFPYHQSILHTATAEYEELPGWEEDISGARSEADLPKRGARLPGRDLRRHRRADQGRSASAPAATR